MSLTRSQSLEQELLAASAVTSIIEDRIYPLVSPRSEGRDLIVYKFQPAEFKYVMGGLNRIEVPLEIRSWSSDYDQAHALADAVQAVLTPAGQAKGFNGKLGGATGINVTSFLIVQEEESRVAIAPDQFVFEICSYYDLKYTP